MKVFTVLQHSEFGEVESCIYGVFSTMEKAIKCVKNAIEECEEEIERTIKYSDTSITYYTEYSSYEIECQTIDENDE